MIGGGRLWRVTGNLGSRRRLQRGVEPCVLLAPSSGLPARTLHIVSSADIGLLGVPDGEWEADADNWGTSAPHPESRRLLVLPGRFIR